MKQDAGLGSGGGGGGGHLLGEERFEGFEEATHSQTISQLDAAVHGGAREGEQLANGVTQLLHAINHLTVLLAGGHNGKRV